MVFESIKLNKQLPRIENLAINYSNLGCIYLACSELLQAEQILRSSLEMNEKLGRLVGMAKDYGNLGQVAKLRGNMPQAREEWTKSRDLFKRIGIPDMVKKVQGWLDGLSNESPE